MTWDGRAFSMRLFRLLKLRGLQLGTACRLAGIERGGKYRWLEGHPPRADMVVRMAAVLHCTPGFLLFGDAEPLAIASEQELADRMLVARVPPPPALRMKDDPLVWVGPVP